MKIIRKGSIKAGIRLVIAVIAFTGLPMSVSFGDDVKEVRYGMIEGRRPTEISSGLFGISKKPGMAYTVRLVLASGRLEIDSPNVSFLVGDCVAVVGEGDKTTLGRAESHLCSNPTAPIKKSVVVFPRAHGAKSEQCTHAQAESATWPQGLGRRRALMRELMVCGQPAGKTAVVTHSYRRSCANAWAKVELMPFGLQRAAARERARAVCREN